jgi:hypothetical protein
MVHPTAIKFTCKYNSHVRNVLQCHQHKFFLISSFFYVFGNPVSIWRWKTDGRKIKLSCTIRPQHVHDFSYLFSCYFITFIKDFGLDLLRIRFLLLYLWYIKTLPEKLNVDKHKFYFRCFKRQNRESMSNVTLRTCSCKNSCRGNQRGLIYSELFCSIIYLRSMHAHERYYIVICGLYGCIINFHIISQITRFPRKRFIENEMWFDFFYKVLWNISISKKNSARCCHKCIEFST